MASDTVDVTLALRNVNGSLVDDPLGVFTFRRLSGGHQVSEQGRQPLRGAAVRFSIAAAREATVCEIDLQRYCFARSPVFMSASGSSHVFDGSLRRERDEWRPDFTLWAALSNGFLPLQTVLRDSADIELLHTGRTLPSLADAAYDAVADFKADRTAVLAKAALLNIYYRLRTAGSPVAGTASWFSFVQKILAIDKERFIARVEPDMARSVREVLDNIEHFKDRFEPADSILHRKNVPDSLKPRIRDMFSLKSTHDAGNYQLTMTELSSPYEVLLDADIDESGTFWGHARDLFKHVVTHGTHPVDVYEILVHQEGKSAGFDLGYSLV